MYHGFDLIGQPDVVLVADEDVIALGIAKGVFEVGRVASLAIVADDADARVAEVANHIERAVGGAVVGDDDLVVG